MKTAAKFTVEDAEELYGINRWGNGYFAAGGNGHLHVRPERQSQRAIDVMQVVGQLEAQGVKTPLLLRFPQLLAAQVHDLAGAFHHAIREFDYGAGYQPVFPIKVNQHRPVVEALLRAGRQYGLGLEVGSLPEMLAATAMDMPEEALTICNGYKDASYLQAAALAARLGRKVVVVMEKPFEIEQFLKEAERQPVMPMIGIRIRLQARGSGMWEKSGGVASKFGLSTAQLLQALGRLHAVGQQDRLSLLHFHIGSQVTEIRRVKRAVREAARIYAKVAAMGTGLRFLDVGGGLGIDYDGSRTSSDASLNYSVREYANDVVYSVKEVCEQEEVDPPHLLSESGRMLAAYHSVLITDVRAAVKGFGDTMRPEGDMAVEPSGDLVDPRVPEPDTDEPQEILEMRETAESISVKNYREFYHDALEYRERLANAFDLGLLSLRQRAQTEEIFWSIVRRAVRYSRAAKFRAEEFLELEKKLHEKYICNFSVFQSLPDHYALDQLFPVVPLHRLDEKPTLQASLADITCDSEGEVEKFVDLRDEKEALEVHALRPGEPYRMAFLLLGAYQDTMGDLHNLFGRVHEAEVTLNEQGETIIGVVRRGESAGDTLGAFGYAPDALEANLKQVLRRGVEAGQLDAAEVEELTDCYRRRLRGYTYLS